MKKRALAFLLSLAMLLTLCPVSVLAEETGRSVIQSGSCGTNVTYTLYSDGELVISGTGKMKITVVPQVCLGTATAAASKPSPLKLA